MRPFTVFHLDGERGFRGGERQLLYLAAALRARGHDNVVCCRAGEALEKEALRQKFEVLGLPFLFEFDPVSAWKVARAAVRRGRPVLHAHTAHAAGIAALAGRLSGLRPVVHRRVDFQLAGGLSRRFKYESAGRVVAVSAAIAEILSKDGVDSAVVPDCLPSTDEERSWTAQNGRAFAPVDLARRSSARARLAREFNIDPKAPWVGNLAALVPHKDHDTLLAAALIVALKRPGTIFLIGGKGPEEERLIASIKRMGLLGKVVICGQRDDPADFLAALDVFVLSSWGEGMGSVLLEAAATGIPVAATKAGGIPEVVEDGKSGLLCEIRSPEALASNIMKLLEDSALARTLAARALENLAGFGLSRTAKRMEDIYASL